MDYEFAVREEEAVGLDLPGRRDDLRHLLRRQLRQVVDELPSVLRVWYDETEGEVVGSNHFTTEIMPFNHLHTLNGLLADAEIQRESDGLQLEELGTEVVLYDAHGRVVVIADVVVNVLLGHLDEDDVGHAVSYLEAAELELGPVVGQFAEKPVRRIGQRLHVLGGARVGIRVRLLLSGLLLLRLIYVQVLQCGTRLIFYLWLAVHFEYIFL